MSDVEVNLARSFERFFASLEGLADLIAEAQPDAIARHARWHDIANLVVELQVSPDRADEFVRLWEAEFGTRDFVAILPPIQNNDAGDLQTVDTDAKVEATAHDVRDQPEKDAKYPRQVIEFITRHGSLFALQRAIRRYSMSWRPILTIAKSTVVFAVGSLESAIADIERIRLGKYVGAMGGDDKEFTLQDLMTLGDLDAVIEEAVERRVDKLCYGSLADWRDWYKKSFGIDMADLALDWPTMEEIVQRRHVMAHNDGRASRLYLRRTGATDIALGDPLPVDPSYVAEVLDQSFVLGIRMIVRAWEKLGEDGDHIATHLVLRSYDLLVDGRWTMALAAAEELTRVAQPHTRQFFIGQVNAWLARRGLGDDVRSDLERWDVDALSEDFQIAKVALLDDYESLRRVLPRALASNVVDRSQLLTWPLFRGLREQPMFAEILEVIAEPPDE